MKKIVDKVKYIITFTTISYCQLNISPWINVSKKLMNIRRFQRSHRDTNKERRELCKVPIVILHDDVMTKEFRQLYFK